MKLLISILIIAAGSAGLYFTGDTETHRSCSCAGAFCSCTTTCLDIDEIPTCSCGTFSCICNCNPKDNVSSTGGQIGNPVLPNMDAQQHDNSRKFETYLRNQGTPGTTSLANQVKGLREAILSQNAKQYLLHAQEADKIYGSLAASEQNKVTDWLNTIKK